MIEKKQILCNTLKDGAYVINYINKEQKLYQPQPPCFVDYKKRAPRRKFKIKKDEPTQISLLEENSNKLDNSISHSNSLSNNSLLENIDLGDDFGFSSCGEACDYESDNDPLSKTVDLSDDFGFSSCDEACDYESDDDPLSKTIDLSDNSNSLPEDICRAFDPYYKDKDCCSEKKPDMIDDFGFSSCDDVYDYESDDDPLSKTVDLSDETSAYYLLEETQNMVVSVTRELGDKIQNMTIKSTSFELGKR